jgi:hypothetical protein
MTAAIFHYNERDKNFEGSGFLNVVVSVVSGVEITAEKNATRDSAF